MPASRVVDVDGLTVTYGDVTAVRDLTFHVQEGELYALLGTNGAGTSSALEVVAGRRRATSGTVRVFGEDPLGRRDARPRTGLVPQPTGAAPDRTVQEAVRVVGGLGEVDDVDRVLGVAGLAGRAGSSVSQLSGGERRRLDFATAVYGRPGLVVLDDPTTGLDRRSREALWDAVHRLRDEGATVLLTTHHLDEAQRHADRIGFLHEGTLRREGSPAELVRSRPSVITFALPPGAPEPPIVGALNGAFHVESVNVQLDLHRLLVWAHDSGVDLRRLRVDPPRLDDVLRGSAAT